MQEEHEIYWTPRTIPPLEHSSIGNYRLEYIIIQTGCSIVYLGTDLRSGDKTVLKFIKRQKDREHRIQNETAIMTMIDHPNILKVLDKYEYRQFYCLVLPYAAGGSLHRIIESQYPNGLPEHTARVIFHQMLSAVKHLHGIGVMHRDIKLDNFLVAQWDLQNPIIQLADFGFAKQFAVGELGNEYLGTPEYASPEMYRHIPCMIFFISFLFLQNSF
ncbi:AGC family protein kinase [Tritrichomonas foetus]|uniref:AGC family protein kinase n=1 Tax=Tritrichomonas foetus TaxID=1144522 RepID=A0A1J4JWP8_9EUKA|nr:AGC family protein kinase [Tritrichomonas foetus]|eukprot:OHT02880.1 AGC family protein kinase [Tritrichomonas foetus]